MRSSEPADEADRAPVIAAADTLKGQLQRSRGAGFAERLACECLWDCTKSIQQLGITAVEISLPGVHERLVSLASVRFEDRNVQRAAQIKLGIETSG